MEGWDECIRALGSTAAKGANLVYVAGEQDSGKTTFCRRLLGALGAGGRSSEDAMRETGASSAYLDCDPGQSSIGPPSTIGLALYTQSVNGGQSPSENLLRFVGGITPVGNMMQLLVGMRALADAGRERGARWIVCDSSGYAAGKAAREFQFQAVDLLRPAHVVAFNGSRDIERMLRCFRRAPWLAIHRIDRSAAATARSPEQRKSHRQDRFKLYFARAVEREIPLAGVGLHGFIPELNRPEACRGTLIALCDGNGFTLCLGVLDRIHVGRGSLTCLCPPVEATDIAVIQFGTYRLEPGFLTDPS